MDANVNFSVSADIARRSGLINMRYRTADGRFILTDKDLQRVRLTPDEFVSGLDAIRLTKSEAEKLIAENNFKMGEASTEEIAEQAVNEETPDVEETEEVVDADETEEEEANNETEE